jgi:hypothetical protein
MAHDTVTASDLDALVPDSAQPEIRTWLRRVIAETQRRNRARAERVLKHDDLVERLRQPPVSMTNPHMWNGYVPPHEGHDAEREAVHSPRGRPNLRKRVTLGRQTTKTRSRDELVKICALAWQRDLQQCLVTGEREPDVLAALPFPLPGLAAPEPPVLFDVSGPEGPADDTAAAHAEPEPDSDPWEREREVQQTFMRGPGRQS